jgi:hypothetical protein
MQRTGFVAVAEKDVIAAVESTINSPITRTEAFWLASLPPHDPADVKRMPNSTHPARVQVHVVLGDSLVTCSGSSDQIIGLSKPFITRQQSTRDPPLQRLFRQRRIE